MHLQLHWPILYPNFCYLTLSDVFKNDAGDAYPKLSAVRYEHRSIFFHSLLLILIEHNHASNLKYIRIKSINGGEYSLRNRDKYILRDLIIIGILTKVQYFWVFCHHYKY